MRSLQTSFSAGELSPALFARVDSELYGAGLATCRNFLVLPQGGAANRPGTRYVGPAKFDDKPARLIPFRFSATENWILEFGDLYMRVIAAGDYVTEGPFPLSGVTRSNPAVATCPGHAFKAGQHVWVEGVEGMTRLNRRYFRVANPLGDTFELDGIDSTHFSPYLSGGSCERVFELETAYPDADVGALYYAQSADFLYLAHPNHPPRRLLRKWDAEREEEVWLLEEVVFTPALPALPAIQVTPSPATGHATWKYRVSAVVGAFTGLVETLATEGLTAVGPSTLEKDSKFITISWSWSDLDGDGNSVEMPAGIKAYRVYKWVDGLYRLLREVGPEVASVVDDGSAATQEDFAPLEDTAQFGGAGRYPSTVGFHEQRLWWGASNEAPHRLWASRSADFENMTAREPRQADDPLTFQLATAQVNRVRHLVSLKNLLIFTSGGEFRAYGGEAGITPSSLAVVPESYRGASQLRPLVIGDTAVYVQDKGERVHDFARRYDSDVWSGSDLTVAARHLFEGRAIAAWDWAQVPFGAAWLVRDDGALLALVYLREYGITAWTRHDTVCGAFESVAVAGEGQEDAPYFIVRREIDGKVARCVERLASRSSHDLSTGFFVDCGLFRDGEPTLTLAGLDHLEGMEVAILADGSVHPRRTVESGAVSLQYPASRVAVGLPITADLETLPLSLSAQGVGRRKQVSRMAVRVESSRGLCAGPTFDALTELKQRDQELWGAPTELATGVYEINLTPSWSEAGRVCIRQENPLPLTVQAVTTEVSLGS